MGFVFMVNHGGGNEQAVKFIPGKDAIGDVSGWQIDGLHPFAVRAEAADPASAPMGNPYAALRICGHSVGIAPFIGKGEPDTFVGKGAAFIQIKGINGAGRAVGVKYCASIEAECRAVGDAITIIHPCPAMVGVESVQGAGLLLVLIVFGARPNAAPSVDFGVIHAIVGTVLFGIADKAALSCIKINQPEAACETSHEPMAPGNGNDPADGLIDLKCLDMLVIERETVYSGLEDIDPEEGVAAFAPHEPFAKQVPIISLCDIIFQFPPPLNKYDLILTDVKIVRYQLYNEYAGGSTSPMRAQ